MEMDVWYDLLLREMTDTPDTTAELRQEAAIANAAEWEEAEPQLC